MTARTIRVDDDLWDAAAKKASLEKRSVSDVLRGALAHYTKGSMLTFPDDWGSVDPADSVFHVVNCQISYDQTGFGLIVRPMERGQKVSQYEEFLAEHSAVIAGVHAVTNSIAPPDPADHYPTQPSDDGNFRADAPRFCVLDGEPWPCVAVRGTEYERR